MTKELTFDRVSLELGDGWCLQFQINFLTCYLDFGLFLACRKTTKKFTTKNSISSSFESLICNLTVMRSESGIVMGIFSVFESKIQVLNTRILVFQWHKCSGNKILSEGVKEIVWAKLLVPHHQREGTCMISRQINHFLSISSIPVSDNYQKNVP